MGGLNEELPSNSDATKEVPVVTEPKTTAIAKGRLGKKKPQNKFIANILTVMSGQNIESAGASVIETIVMPALADLVVESLHGLIDRVFDIGTSSSYSRGKGRGGRGGKVTNANYTPYRDVSNKSRKKNTYKRRGDRIEVVVFDSRKEAEDVLYQMRQILEAYDCVTAEDYCIACNVPQDDNYMNGEWGWYDLSNVRIRRTVDGSYYLDMPKVVEIEEDEEDD